MCFIFPQTPKTAIRSAGLLINRYKLDLSEEGNPFRYKDITLVSTVAAMYRSMYGAPFTSGGG
jgi:hypothetical protein